MAQRNQLPRKTRRRVFIRDNWKCWYCGQQVQSDNYSKLNCATIDHVRPESKGGGNDDENLVTACKSCNAQKRNRNLEEYRAFIRYSIKSEGKAITHILAAMQLSPTPHDKHLLIAIQFLERQIGDITFSGEVNLNA